MSAAPSSDEAASNVRYPRRTRVKPLDWFLSERINYECGDDGLFKVAGIHTPRQYDNPWQPKQHKTHRHTHPKRSMKQGECSVTEQHCHVA